MSHRPSNPLVAGGVRGEVVCGGGEGQSSSCVEFSEVSVGTLVALNRRGSASKQHAKNQKPVEIAKDQITYHKLS